MPDPTASDLAPEAAPAVGTAASKNPVRYLSAATEAQEAHEWEYSPGHTEGIMTHNLLPHLDPKEKLKPGAPPPLKQLCQAVDEDSENLQHPVLANVQESDPILGVGGAGATGAATPPVPAANVQSLWDAFYDFNVNRDFVQIHVYPKKQTFPVNTPFTLSLEAKEPGYVLLLGKDETGAITLFYPALGGVGGGVSADRCAFRAGQEQPLGSISFPAPGITEFKAVYIKDAAMVESYLRAFAGLPNSTLTKAGAKGAVVAHPADARIFTSQFTLEGVGGDKTGGGGNTRKETKP